MDKNIKKEILNKYKQDELEKLSQSDNKALADFAKNKLGLKSEKLSVERLRTTSDDKLIETITKKISEVLEIKYQADRKRYKNVNNVIPELNESLRAVYFTDLFEMYVRIGDTEKFLGGASEFELSEIIGGYRILNMDNVSNKISLRAISHIEMELSDLDRIQRIKIEYIREHLNEFVLN
jgi:hypothetical protein